MNVTLVIFSSVLMLVGVLLVVRQLMLRNRIGHDWVHSARRYYRRLFIGFLFVLIGGLLLVDDLDLITIAGNSTRLMVYVGCLGGLSLYMFMLAVVDALETMRSASAEMTRMASVNPEVYRVVEAIVEGKVPPVSEDAQVITKVKAEDNHT